MRVRDILLSVQPEISGQLIVTTHNTLLMDSELPASTFYIIDKDEDGRRHISCITETVDRVHPNHNTKTDICREITGDPENMKIR